MNYVENDFVKIKEIKKRIRMGWKLLKLEYLNYYIFEMNFLWFKNFVILYWFNFLIFINLIYENYVKFV